MSMVSLLVLDSCIFHQKLCRNKTVVVSLWNELATDIGQQLLDTVDSAPVVAIKSLKVGDFQGMYKE